MLSKKAKYGLKAMFLLAQRYRAGEVVGIREMARSEGIPVKFLEAILLELKNSGFLWSKRGPGGGYALARAPQSIYVGEILRLLDGPLAPVPCVSKSAYRPCEECPDEAHCGVRLVMQRTRDAIAEVLDGASLAEAAAEASESAEGQASVPMYHI